MSSRLYINFRNDQKAAELPKGMRTVIRRCIEATLKETGFKESAEVSVTLVDNAQIKKLNNEYRGKNKETDVLSFPLSDGDEYDIDPDNGACMLGDIVISLEKAMSQAKEYGHGLIREVGFLSTHSTLHLLGYDHENDLEGERIMNELQEKVLNSLDIRRGSTTEE